VAHQLPSALPRSGRLARRLRAASTGARTGASAAGNKGLGRRIRCETVADLCLCKVGSFRPSGPLITRKCELRLCAGDIVGSRQISDLLIKEVESVRIRGLARAHCGCLCAQIPLVVQRLEQANESLDSGKLSDSIRLGQRILSVGGLDLGDEVVDRSEVGALGLSGTAELALREQSGPLACNRLILLLLVCCSFAGTVIRGAMRIRICARGRGIVRHFTALSLQLLEGLHLRTNVRQPPVCLLLHRLRPARGVRLQVAGFRQADLREIDVRSSVSRGALGLRCGPLVSALLLPVLAGIVFLCLTLLVRLQQLVPCLLVAHQRDVPGHRRRF